MAISIEIWILAAADGLRAIPIIAAAPIIPMAREGPNTPQVIIEPIAWIDVDIIVYKLLINFFVTLMLFIVSALHLWDKLRRESGINFEFLILNE